MKKNFISLTAAVLFITACGSTKLLVPTQSDAERATKKYSSASLASLNEGKTLFEQNCGQCHGLKNPAGRSEEKWNAVVPRMVKKVNKKAGTEKLGSKEQELILQYVVTMGSAPKPTK